MQVAGTLVDYNGREQRASRTISIGGKVQDCDLELKLVKEEYETGEKIRLNVLPLDAEGNATPAEATVVVMKLSPTRSRTSTVTVTDTAMATMDITAL